MYILTEYEVETKKMNNVRKKNKNKLIQHNAI